MGRPGWNLRQGISSSELNLSFSTCGIRLHDQLFDLTPVRRVILSVLKPALSTQKKAYKELGIIHEVKKRKLILVEFQ